MDKQSDQKKTRVYYSSIHKNQIKKKLHALFCLFRPKTIILDT